MNIQSTQLKNLLHVRMMNQIYEYGGLKQPFKYVGIFLKILNTMFSMSYS